MLSIAARYASSVFQKAKEKNQIEEVMKDLEQFIKLLEKNKNIAELWNSLSISSFDKEEIILKKIELSEITKKFLKLILLKKRQKLLPKIFYYYKLMYNNQNKILEVDIKTAFQINNQELEKIIKTIEEKLSIKIKIKNIYVDKEILGGIVVISDNLVLDLSVRKDLDKLLKNVEEVINNKLSSIKILS